MDILIDTNIYVNNILMSSNDILLLLDYLDRTKSKVLMPKVILEEIRGYYSRTFKENLDKANKHISIIHKCIVPKQDKPSFINLKIDQLTEDYCNYILQKMRIDNNEIIDYDPTHIPDIVNRAVYRKKPLDQKGNGFRDGLILEYFTQSGKKIN